MKKALLPTLILALSALAAPRQPLTVTPSVAPLSLASSAATLTPVVLSTDPFAGLNLLPWLSAGRYGCNLGNCADCSDAGGFCCLVGRPRVTCICVLPPATSCPPA